MSEELITLWRIEHGIAFPIETRAKSSTHPNRDAAGLTIYTNTHFTSRAEAWKGLLAEVRAAEQLSLRSVKETEKNLEMARAVLLEHSRVGIETRENFEKEQRAAANG